MRTSYSNIQTFKQCPQKFKFQVIDKIKAPKTVHTVFGSSVHASMKYMFSHDPVFPTLDEILSNFKETWGSSAQKIVPALDNKLISIYEESGKSIIKNFYKNNPPWNFSVVDTESKFEVPIEDPNGGGHVLAGIIDRIDKISDGVYEIIDYKTNRRLPAQNAVDGDLQMSIYHMALNRRWPSLDPAKIKLSLYFLKHGEKLSSSREVSSITATKDAVLSTIKQMEKNIAENTFPAITSILCDYCAYKPICPAWKHFYKKTDAPPAPDENQLQQALQEYFAIKESETNNDKRVKDLQSIIKAYMEAHKVDRVFDERGYYVSKKLQQRFKYDFEKVKAILTGANLMDKWNAILEADEKKLKEIMVSLPSPIRDQVAAQKNLSKEFITLTASTKPAKK
ncbi:MAG: hypothetical protein UW30_C0001G0085 [Candidatus Giovannonibacteria bacterium GW2011_GWA2_44_13b]|uniref:PD-(D/E)XK endonuclease-like domain-containing protein n=2 Tax=Candidatus Giovannoniibacteriota TaxID=1752738 RepID=A0A0G1H6E8_9BACT|nr:MAG: hypothetical protein UW30_C0001G0085 [Candidatus Giovannonibacteria bacterium GW2011_GWA2_44_13b]OGF82783.1 MAG: hypothetical protein A2924_04150 [Candidatus Giovannonibacteria bacterium RIFCSPLOWO2_01_FULL_44_16]